MKFLFLLYLSLAGAFASPPIPARPGPAVLARVEVASFSHPPELPVHAILQDREGHDYLLVIAAESELAKTNLPWRLLAGGVTPEECLLAVERRRDARQTAAGRFEILHDDGLRWVLRANAADAEELADLGFALQRLPREKVTWPTAAQGRQKDHGLPASFEANPLVTAMVAGVQSTNLHTMVARLSGLEPVLAAGSPRLINTRRTASGLPLTNALATAFARLDALGLQPIYQLWTSTSYTNRNLCATLPGIIRSNEIVLVTAHLDDMPSGTLAPGADDNASGCAAVLTAAGIYSQYLFERTIRFVLFTGEEQGLLGSASYAAAARTAGDNIVAVLNLDMIGWDGSKPATFQLHTRTTGNPGYTNDLAIAAVFTNAVSVYGLRTELMPVIRPDGLNASDHYAFWDKNFPAVAATEDYNDDFNPYYHTVNDTLARLNMPYFTAAVRATVATVAHLAQPLSLVPSAVLEVANSDWTPNSGIGGSVLVTRHWPGAEEVGLEAFDLAVTNTLPNSNPRWLKLDTLPYGVELAMDSRSPASESAFSVDLSAVAAGSLEITCTNKLRFDFLSPPALDRIYLARIEIAPQFTPDHTRFSCLTNVRSIVAAGGYVRLPGLTSATPGAEYGVCEIAVRFLDVTSAACPLSLVSITGSNLVFATRAQAGTRIRDEIEFATQLPATNWSPLATFELEAHPNPTSFETGWQPVEWWLDTSSLPASAPYFFRLKRTWLAW